MNSEIEIADDGYMVQMAVDIPVIVIARMINKIKGMISIERYIVSLIEKI